MKFAQLRLKSKQQKPILKLKSRTPQGSAMDRSDFNALVRKALEVTQELNVMNTPPARKLSARALLRETLATIQGSPERVKQLRSAIEDGSPGLDHSRATMRRMIQFLRGPSWSFAPKEPRRLNFLTTDATNGELAARRNSSVELFCVAVQIAGEKHPECFGTNESTADYAARFKDLSEQQRELFARIGTSMTADDLDIGTPDLKGNALVSFKLGGGRIPIAPQDNAGERLVNYLIATGKHRT